MKNLLITAAFSVTTLVTAAAVSQPSIQIGGGGMGGDCGEVGREIARNWFHAKRFLTEERSLKRPRSSQFQCVSPGYLRNAMPRTVPGAADLKCFQVDGQGGKTGVCCDARMAACATLAQ